MGVESIPMGGLGHEKERLGDLGIKMPKIKRICGLVDEGFPSFILILVLAPFESRQIARFHRQLAKSIPLMNGED